MNRNSFARRIVHSDLKWFLSKGFIVEQGTQALFFENGVLQDIISAGKVELGGPLERLLSLDFSRNVEVVVCDAGDVEFAYMFGGKNPETDRWDSPIKTADGFPLQPAWRSCSNSIPQSCSCSMC